MLFIFSLVNIFKSQVNLGRARTCQNLPVSKKYIFCCYWLDLSLKNCKVDLGRARTVPVKMPVGKSEMLDIKNDS